MDREDLRKSLQEAQKLQLDLVKAQAELSSAEIKVSSDDGSVVILMNAQGDFKSLKIDPALVGLGVKVLEKKILETLKKGNKAAAASVHSNLSKVMKGLGL